MLSIHQREDRMRMSSCQGSSTSHGVSICGILERSRVEYHKCGTRQEQHCLRRAALASLLANAIEPFRMHDRVSVRMVQGSVE